METININIDRDKDNENNKGIDKDKDGETSNITEGVISKSCTELDNCNGDSNDNDNDNESADSSEDDIEGDGDKDIGDVEKISETDEARRKKYKKLKYRLKSIKKTIKFLKKDQVHDVWYPSNFLHNYIPVIKGTLEYQRVIILLKSYRMKLPHAILKKKTKEGDIDKDKDKDKEGYKNIINYSCFYEGALPFKLTITDDILPDEITMKPVINPDLFLLTDNLLKS